MPKSATIILTTAGADTGPFSLLSDADSFSSPFETNVSKASLVGGYTSNIVPDAATIIRVQSSSSLCTNYVDAAYPTETTTSTTTTTTTTAAPTTSTTTTTTTAAAPTTSTTTTTTTITPTTTSTTTTTTTPIPTTTTSTTTTTTTPPPTTTTTSTTTTTTTTTSTCECWTVVNDDTVTINYTYTDCGGTIISLNILPGVVRKHCIQAGSSFIVNSPLGGLLSEYDCMQSCTTPATCPDCSLV